MVILEKDQEVPSIQASNATLLNLLTTDNISHGAQSTHMKAVIKQEFTTPKTQCTKQEQSLPDIDTLFHDIRMQSETKGATKVVTSSPHHQPDQQPVEEDHELLDLDKPSEFTFYDDQMIIKQEPVFQNENSFHSCSDADDLESVESMIMDSVTQDIQFACQILDIPRDPVSWTPEQVQKWVLWTLNEYNLPQSLTECFQMNGYRLCSMTEAELTALNATAGPTLYAQRDIWRNSLKYSDCTPQQTIYFGDLYSVDKGTTMYSEDYNTAYTPTTVTIDTPPPSVSPAPSNPEYSRFGYGEDVSRRATNCGVMRRPQARQTIHLWQFLRELLDDVSIGTAIRWIDRERGIFKIEDSVRVAKLWGKRKNRPAMNYDKLSRSIRQYYKKGIIKKTEHSKRLVYQFCAPYL